MVDPLGVGVGLEVLSGLGLAGVGVLLFFARTRRVYTMVLAFFLLLWSALVLSSAAIEALSAAGLAEWIPGVVLFRTAVLVDAYLPLAYFATVYPVRRGLARRWSGVALLVAPAVLGTGLLVAAPGLFLTGVAGPLPVPKPLVGILTHVYAALFSGAFYYAAYSLYVHHGEARTRAEQKRTLGVLAAFLAFVGFTAALKLVDVALPTWGAFPPSVTDAILSVEAVIGVGVTGVAAFGILAGPGPRSSRATVALAGIGSLVAGSIAAQARSLPGVDPLALWRLLAVVGIAYAIIRYETFDIEVKLARSAAAAGIFGVAVGFGVGLYQGLVRWMPADQALVWSQSVLFGVLVVMALSLRASDGALSRLLDRLGRPRRLEARRLEVYEAALAQAVSEGWSPERRAFLEDLRRRLGLSRSEHELLSRLVEPSEVQAQGEPSRLGTGDRVDDRYDVVRPLGEGTGGRTYEAIDRAADRRVVLKMLSLPATDREEALRAFVREARLAAGIEHRGVVRVLDVGLVGDVPYLVMEHVSGGSLRDRLDEEGRLAPHEAVRIGCEVLEALSHLHDRGIVHRDIKPANVLLTPKGEPRIADFGIAVEPDPRDTAGGLPSPGAPRGSPAYMSPEAVRGEPPSPSMDLYSVSAMVYEMLTGRTYLDLEGLPGAEMMRQIRDKPPRPFPDDVPDDLVLAVTKGLAKDPADRYRSAREMARALQAIT